MSASRNTFGVTRLATLTAAAVIPLMGAAVIETAVFPEAGFFMQSAQAQQGQGKGGNHDNLLNIGRGKGQMGTSQGRGQMGGTAESAIFRDDAGGPPEGKGQGAGGDGRPDNAGGGGRPDDAGGGGGPDSGKGGDYGDIFVILRNDDGTPVLDDNGNTQPCLDPACETVIQLVEDEDGKYEVPAEYADQVIPVEFGRLNVARSPSSVTEHSLAELLSKFDGASIDDMATLIASTDESGRLIDADGNTVDSPLENFALYVALLEAVQADPDATSYTLEVSTNPKGDEQPESFSMTVSADVVPTLAASAFAAASDKTGDLTVDEIMGITGFVNLAEALSTMVESADYSYDPAALYDGVMVTVLEEVVIDGQTYYREVDVNVYDAVMFNTIPTIDDDGNGIDTFTQQADDAVQVLEFVHDYAIDAE